MSNNVQVKYSTAVWTTDII